MLPRFCEYDVKKVRSPTCSRQEHAIFLPHILRTWEAYFSPSLYLGVQFILRLSTTFPFKNFDFMRKIRGGEEGKTDESMIY